jgi:hypothetical protein
MCAAMDVCTSSSDNELSNDCDIQAKYKNNAVNYLTVNEKGKFKWIGSFEELNINERAHREGFKMDIARRPL